MMHTKSCSHCRTGFQITTARLNQGQEFCSVRCRNVSRADLTKPGNRPSCKVHFPKCAHCRQPFVARWTRKFLCSEECAKGHTGTLLRAIHPGQRECRTCKGTFSVEYGNKGQFCSDICRQIPLKAASKKRRKHGSKGSDRHRKRARRYGVEYEPIRLSNVLTRDGWMCGLCETPISKDARYPDPLMPSLDHIVPMSKGGPHLYTNVQAAHHRCNTLKRDRVDVERAS